jgi:hypothetical protein
MQSQVIPKVEFIMPHYDILAGKDDIAIRHGERYPAYKSAAGNIVATGDNGKEYIISAGRYTTTKREQIKIASGYAANENAEHKAS